MKLKIILIGCLLMKLSGYAQVEIPAHLAVQLKDNRTFKTYAKVMTGYLDSLLAATTDSVKTKLINKQYKFLARQLYYLEGHLDGKGDIINANEKNFAAAQNLDTEYGANLIESTNGNWTRVGPDFVNASYGTKGIGRADRIAFHPTNQNIIYAGTPCSGLFKTTTGGTIWSNLNNYIPSLGISGLVVSHANPTTLYVLTGDGDSNLGQFGFVEGFDYIRPSIGVLKSTDDGASWQRSNLNIPGLYVGYKLIQSPTDANVLIAATSKGLYRTGDGGSNWDLVSADSSRYYDLEWKPGSSAQLYASTANQLYMSVSAGLTWANITNRITGDITAAHRIALAVTPANSAYLYVMAGTSVNSGSATHYQLFRSTNSAGNFFLRYDATTSGGSAKYTFNIAASPLDGNKIVIGNLNCRYSDDGGLNFTRSSQYNDDQLDSYVHADIHDLIYNPVSGTLFIGSDGAVFTSTNDGTSHFGRYLGFTATQFYHFDVNEANTDMILGGAQDNGILLKDDNTSFFKNYAAGDGFDIVFPHGFGTYTVASINKNVYFYYNTFPSTWWVINQQNNVWYKPVAMSYFDSSKFIGGVSKIIKFVVVDPGSSPSEYDGNGRWALITSPSNNNRLYAAGGPEWNDYGDDSEKDLIRSDDKAATWTSLKSGSGFPSIITKITSIAVNQLNSNQVYFTMGGYEQNRKVYYSANAGANWTNRSGSLPNLPVNAIAVTSAGDMYIGTDVGVFYRSSTASDWIPFYNGLPKIPVTELKIVGSTLYASTFGRGIWKTDLASACVALINLTANQSGRIFYEATRINASPTLINGAGTEIYMKAEIETTLLPGFRANANTGEEFRTWIANCGTGGIPFSPVNENLANSFAISTDSAYINFNLPYGALVSIYGADEDNIAVVQIGKSYRLQEGAQKIEFPVSPQYPNLVIVADGQVMGFLKRNGDSFSLQNKNKQKPLSK